RPASAPQLARPKDDAVDEEEKVSSCRTGRPWDTWPWWWWKMASYSRNKQPTQLAPESGVIRNKIGMKYWFDLITTPRDLLKRQQPFVGALVEGPVVVVIVVGRKKALREKEVVSKVHGSSASHDLLSKRKKGMEDIYKSSKEPQKLNTNDFQSHIQYLWSIFSTEELDSFDYFDCLWFTYSMKSSTQGKVASWIKHKNVFTKKYTFVPICVWGHWSLLILCHLGGSSSSNPPVMLLLDSLHSADPTRFFGEIKK
ncbi:hypothetical protein Taro_031426, partial [Colocasia esculenta]|nr:hypothetical protein [Colocasia esculenta]